MSPSLTILEGDALTRLRELPSNSIQSCVTSPPYWGLRDYGVAGQMGLEATPEKFVVDMGFVFEEVRRVLKPDGTCWVNMGDSYAAAAGKNRTEEQACANSTLHGGFGHQLATLKQQNKIVGDLKPKDLCGMPWRLAFALQDAGWYLRCDIIWHKPNPMPESVTDRPTKSHEYIFLLSKSQKYYYNAEAIAEPALFGDRGSSFVDDRDKLTKPNLGQGQRRKSVARGDFNGKTNALEGREAFRAITDMRNKRSVWTVPTHPFKEAHFATFPPDLIKPCILAGSRAGDIILDPFGGSGTTGMVALELGRNAILIELNPEYVALARRRCMVTPGLPLEMGRE